MLNKLTLIATTFVMLQSGVALAQKFSRDILVRLHDAKVSDEVLVQQIDNAGIDFVLTDEIAEAFTRSGFSPVVIAALRRVSSGDASASAQYRTLYAEGKYTELADLLKVALEKSPSDQKTRAVFILLLLRIGETTLARAEFEKLNAAPGQDTATALYASKVQAAMDAFSQQQNLKKQLLDSIDHLDATAAADAIDKLSNNPVQKQLLTVQILSLQAAFPEARQALAQFTSASFKDRDRAKALGELIAAREKAYNEAAVITEKYLHSEYAVATCFAGYDVSKELNVSEYLHAVGSLYNVAPLSPLVIDDMFHATLISSKYAAVESFGDRILRAVGRISIQGYSSDRYFKLVIDARAKDIHVEPDDHEFLSLGSKHNNSWNGQLVPFKLGFDEITGLSQKAGGSLGGAIWKNPLLLEKGAYALKLAPRGTVPQYALMNYLQCSSGQGAQENATYNLGRFVLHVIGSDRVKANLVKPKENHTDAGAPFMAGLIGAQTAMGGAQTPLSSLGTAALVQAMNQQAQLGADAKQNWKSVFNQSDFDIAGATAVVQLEQLLNLI